MFSILHKSFSGESRSQEELDPSDQTELSKKSKHNRSGDASASDDHKNNNHKRKRMNRKRAVDGDEDLEQQSPKGIPLNDVNARTPKTPSSVPVVPTLPAKTPDWGIKLLEIIQGEFRKVNESIGIGDEGGKTNSQ